MTRFGAWAHDHASATKYFKNSFGGDLSHLDEAQEKDQKVRQNRRLRVLTSLHVYFPQA